MQVYVMASFQSPSRVNCIASAPRPWLTRASGECAFPVGGRGWTTRSCCNPCGAATYCPAHAGVMRGPAAPPIADVERDLRRRGI